LIEAGADPRYVNDNGNTLLMVADSAEVVDCLVASGCILTARNKWAASALDTAVENSRHDVAIALIRCGADVNDRNEFGYNALMYACSACNIDCILVKQLLEAGADVHAKTKQAATALHLAAQYSELDFSGQDLYGNRRGKLGDVVRILVNAGAAVDARDDDGNTPLHNSVGSNGMEISAITALLECGADVNAVNDFGMSPLMVATHYSHNEYAPDAVRALVSHGADTHVRCHDGLSARDHADEVVAAWKRIVAIDANRPPGAPKGTYKHDEILRSSMKSVLAVHAIIHSA
jgi:cytohesin